MGSVHLKSTLHFNENYSFSWFQAKRLFLLLFFLYLTCPATGGEQQGASSFSIKIVTPGNRARLCSEPDCGPGTELSRLPTNIILEITASRRIKSGYMEATWYNVTYGGKTGWVSEYDTKPVK